MTRFRYLVVLVLIVLGFGLDACATTERGYYIQTCQYPEWTAPPTVYCYPDVEHEAI